MPEIFQILDTAEIVWSQAKKDKKSFLSLPPSYVAHGNFQEAEEGVYVLNRYWSSTKKVSFLLTFGRNKIWRWPQIML